MGCVTVATGTKSVLLHRPQEAPLPQFPDGVFRIELSRIGIQWVSPNINPCVEFTLPGSTVSLASASAECHPDFEELRWPDTHRDDLQLSWKQAHDTTICVALYEDLSPPPPRKDDPALPSSVPPNAKASPVRPPPAREGPSVKQLLKQWTIQLALVLDGPVRHSLRLDNSSMTLFFDMQISQVVPVEMSAIEAILELPNPHPGEEFHFSCKLIVEGPAQNEDRSLWHSSPSYSVAVPLTSFDHFSGCSTSGDEVADPKSIAHPHHTVVEWHERFGAMPRLAAEVYTGLLARYTLQMVVWTSKKCELEDQMVVLGESNFPLWKFVEEGEAHTAALLLHTEVVGSFALRLQVRHPPLLNQNKYVCRTEDGIAPLLSPGNSDKGPVLASYAANALVSYFNHLAREPTSRLRFANLQKDLALMQRQLRNSKPIPDFPLSLPDLKRLVTNQSNLIEALRSVETYLKLEDKEELAQKLWQIALAIIQRPELSLKYLSCQPRGKVPEPSEAPEKALSTPKKAKDWLAPSGSDITELAPAEAARSPDKGSGELPSAPADYSDQTEIVEERKKVAIRFRDLLHSLLSLGLSRHSSQLENESLLEFLAASFARIPIFKRIVCASVCPQEPAGALLLHSRSDSRACELWGSWEELFAWAEKGEGPGCRNLERALKRSGWLAELEKRQNLFHRFVGKVAQAPSQFPVLRRGLWEGRREHEVLFLSFVESMREFKTTFSFSKSLLATATQLLLTNDFLNVYLRVVADCTPLDTCESTQSVASALKTFALFLDAATDGAQKALPLSFDDSFFFEMTRRLLAHPHYLAQFETLALLKRFYECFPSRLRKTLSLYLLGQAFFDLFFHWESAVRQRFYQLVLARIGCNPNSPVAVQLRFREVVALTRVAVDLRQKETAKGKVLRAVPYYQRMRERLRARRHQDALKEVFVYSPVKLSEGLKSTVHHSLDDFNAKQLKEHEMEVPVLQSWASEKATPPRRRKFSIAVPDRAELELTPKKAEDLSMDDDWTGRTQVYVPTDFDCALCSLPTQTA